MGGVHTKAGHCLRGDTGEGLHFSVQESIYDL